MPLENLRIIRNLRFWTFYTIKVFQTSNDTKFLHFIFFYFPVFFFGGQSSPYMPLTFILLQNISYHSKQGRINMWKPFRNIFMYGTLTDSKLFCTISDSCLIVNYVFRTFQYSLFNICFQKNLCIKHTLYILCRRIFCYTLWMVMYRFFPRFLFFITVL